MPDKTRTNIYLEPKQYEWLRDHAHQERTSMAEVIRTALDLYSFVHAFDRMQEESNLSSMLENMESQPGRWWQEVGPQAEASVLKARLKEARRQEEKSPGPSE